jgi:hypothetical protein
MTAPSVPGSKLCSTSENTSPVSAPKSWKTTNQGGAVEIAETLVIGENTIKTHAGNILRKIHLDDRTSSGLRLATRHRAAQGMNGHLIGFG